MWWFLLYRSLSPSCIGWYSSIRPDNPYKSAERRWHLFAMGEILLYIAHYPWSSQAVFHKNDQTTPLQKVTKMVAFIFNGRHFYYVAYYLPSQHRLNLSNTTRKDTHKNARNLQWGTFYYIAHCPPSCTGCYS